MKRASDPGSSGLFDVVRETIRRNEEPSEGAELPDVRAHPGPEERFKRGEVLGEGGEGKIYAALDELLGREVAVKVLSEEGSPARARGLREARALSRLDHPSIVPVHDLVAREDGSATLVMKLVRGRNLTDVLSQVHDRPPPPAVLFDIVTIVVRLAEALAHAHELGVLHLDIKPANIMVGGYGEVHLMDWGASLGPDPAEWGPPMLGTPGFMAPEQLWDEPNHVDHRAD
ncbi:MAG: serine/threonine-protein kinase, partial [Myxococcota bacterium]